MRIWTLTAIALVLLIACMPVNPQPWVIILLFCYLVMTLWPIFLPKWSLFIAKIPVLSAYSSRALDTHSSFKPLPFQALSLQHLPPQHLSLKLVAVLGLIGCVLHSLNQLEDALAWRLPSAIDHKVFQAKGVITAHSIRSLAGGADLSPTDLSQHDLSKHELSKKNTLYSIQSIKLDIHLLDLALASKNRDLVLNEVMLKRLRDDHPKVRLSYYPMGFGYKAYASVSNARLNPKRLLDQFYVGKVICFEAKLRRPRGLLNFTGFDYEKWLIEQGYYATGYIKSLDDDCVAPDKQALPWYQNGRLSVIASLNALFDQKQWGNSDVMLALITGSKERMTQARKTWLAQAGLSHLIVISGLHIGLIMAAVYLLIYQLAVGLSVKLNHLPYSPRVVASLFAIAAAWSYCLLSGFSASAMRAAIMGTALCVARAYGLRWPVLSGLLLAMLILLLLNPLNALASGFWLSFGAVLMIYWAILFARLPKSTNSFSSYQSHQGRHQSQEGRHVYSRWVQPVIMGFWQLVRVQFALLLLLTPVVLFTVETFHLASFVTNLFCVPIFSLIIVPALLVIALIYAILPELGVLGFDVINTLLVQVFDWVDAMMSLENSLGMGNWSEFIRLDGLALGLALLALFLLVYFRSALGLLPLLLLLPVLIPPDNRPELGEARIEIIDVGQGLSIVIYTQNYRLIYDTGPRFGDFDVGEQIVVPRLRETGPFHTNHSVESDLVISHADMDHAGGSQSVLSYLNRHKGVQTVDIYSGEPNRLSHTWLKSWLKDNDVKVQSCHGLSWQRDGVDFTFFDQPRSSKDLQLRSNNQSCVLKVTAGGKSILLTGDIEAKAEAQLLDACGTQKNCPQFDADILVVAHHGSRTSSKLSFIQAVSPDLAIVSSGYKNRFRHPHPYVVERFEQEGVDFISTSQTGGVTLELSDSAQSSEFSLQTARHSRYRPWYLRTEAMFAE